MMVSRDVLYCVYTSNRTGPFARSDFLALFLLLHHFLEKRGRRGHIWCESSCVLQWKSAVLILATPFLTSWFVECLQWRSQHTMTQTGQSWTETPRMQGPELTASHCQLRSHTQELSDPKRLPQMIALRFAANRPFQHSDRCWWWGIWLLGSHLLFHTTQLWVSKVRGGNLPPWE